MRKILACILAFLAFPVQANTLDELARSLSTQIAPHVGVPVDLSRSGPVMIFHGLVVVECECPQPPWARAQAVLDMTQGNMVFEVYDWENLEGFGREALTMDGYMIDEEGVFFWAQSERKLVGPGARQSFFEGRVRLAMSGKEVYVLRGPMVGLTEHDKQQKPLQARVVLVEAR